MNNVSSVPSSSSSSFCQQKQKHDVFLSFRGKDTRLNFMEHLHAALIQQGISTFRDDQDLEKGEIISTQLVQAIEGSKVSVVIVSPNYASSEWCLDELVKILEFRKVSEEGTSMRTLLEHEEKDHNLESRCKKCKASLQNKEDISNHNNRKQVKLSLRVNDDEEWAGSVYTGGKTMEIVISDDISDELLHQIYRFVGMNPLQNSCDRRMATEVRVLVNYDGEWVNSTYVGGKTKGMVIPEDITYQGLVDRVYSVVGVDSHEYKLILKTKYDSKLPTQPVEIINDDDLAFFIKENLSWDMRSRIPFCTTLERRPFPYGRMESYHGYLHGVTPDPVPYLQQPYYQQQQSSYQQTSTWQPYYEQYNPFYQQQLQWGYQQHHPSYIQPQCSYQQLPWIFWYHYQPHTYPPICYQ